MYNAVEQGKGLGSLEKYTLWMVSSFCKGNYDGDTQREPWQEE